MFTWTLAWVLSLALLAFGPKFVWDFAVGYSIAVIVVNLFCGYKMIMANKMMLEGLDELQRKLHMNAMAISLGVSMIFGAVYGLLEGIRLIDFHPNPSSILVVMGLSYVISLLIGTRKYQ
ncbi:hypothetical protein EYQ95_09190 [Lysobacter sp. N42]|nr:hypothetical protein DQX04_07855 [Aliidiomarina sp. B3213]TCZ91035.1 hypothetical protein EYQ95_09190 [Lysobacter sp. N42]